MSEKPKLGILKAYKSYHEQYAKSCEELRVPYEVIDLFASNWLDVVQSSDCVGFLARPPAEYQEMKLMYDERLFVIHKLLNKSIYPSYNELLLYENKRLVSHWLALHEFPHPRTHVFASKTEAQSFVETAEYPLVFKSNIGSAGIGVDIVRSKRHAKRIIHQVFGRFHPALSPGRMVYRMKRRVPVLLPGLSQRHYLIVQEYKEIKWEWRIIRIGDSFWGHQKLLKGNMASGSGRVGWVRPPRDVLLLAKEISERGPFWSMAYDIFETVDGEYLVNELQSLFGSILDSQMRIDDVPGRFKFTDEEFVFEEGEFNRFGSYLARVEHFLEILDNR